MIRLVDIKVGEQIAIVADKTEIVIKRDYQGLWIMPKDEEKFLHTDVQGVDYTHTFGGVKYIRVVQGLGGD